MWNDPPPGLIKALFDTAAHSFESLSLMATEAYLIDADMVLEILAPLLASFPLVASSLRNLSFPASTPPTALNPLLRHCTSLQFVSILFTDPIDFIPTILLGPLRLTVDTLPPSISRLSFDVFHLRAAIGLPDANARFALEAISSPSMTSLKRIDFFNCTGWHLRALEEAGECFAECERREIPVVCDGEWV